MGTKMDEKDSETPVNTFQEFDNCETELFDIMKSMKELNENYNNDFKELQQKFKFTLKEMKSEVSKFKKSIKKLSKIKKKIKMLENQIKVVLMNHVKFQNF